MKRLVTVVICIGIYFLSSCHKDYTTQSNSDIAGYRYFPVDTGHWVIYDVDSIVINSTHSIPYDTFYYRLKEYIPSTFIDNTGNLTERIERYIWVDTLNAWNIDNVWTSNLHPNDAEKVEDNVRYIKLSFPVSYSATWNGNALNSLYPEWDYTYSQIDQPLTIGNLHFDSTLTVIQVLDSNIVYKHIGIEQYAKGVGMIYKKFEIDSFNNTLGIEYGFNLIMTIESYHQ
jgi:hypothetical protein